jgi:hypothetical protein
MNKRFKIFFIKVGIVNVETIRVPTLASGFLC